MAQSELDKLLKAFEDKNTSMEYYILMSIDGIPFKSNIEKKEEKENSPQEITSNKGYYIKSGFVLFIVFLF